MIIWYVICDVVIYKVCGRGGSFCFHFDYGEGCWFGYSRVFLITQYLDGFLYIINTLKEGTWNCFLIHTSIDNGVGRCLHTQKGVSRCFYTHNGFGRCFHAHIGVWRCFHAHKCSGRCFHANTRVGR